MEGERGNVPHRSGTGVRSNLSVSLLSSTDPHSLSKTNVKVIISFDGRMNDFLNNP
jgi:hypothetical protein